MDIKFTIPDNKIQLIIDTMKWHRSKPEDSALTDAQWAKEVIRLMIIDLVAMHQKETTVIEKDDSLIT